MKIFNKIITTTFSIILLSGLAFSQTDSIQKTFLFKKGIDEINNDSLKNAFVPLKLQFSTSANWNLMTQIKNESSRLRQDMKTRMIFLNPLKPILPIEEKSESTGFYKNLLYFLGTSAIVTVTYFLFSGKEKPNQTKLTFGTPPLPK